MHMYIYIYVDDIREDDTFFNKTFDRSCWMPIICRNYEDTIRVIDEFHESHIIFIDLDHDLGEGNEIDDKMALSGYDICKYIVENKIPILGFHIHSMNPIGSANMRQLLTHYGYREYE